MSKITILQYHIFDIPLKPNKLLAFMATNFEMVKNNASFFTGIENPLALFHNKTAKYSSIQFGVKNNSLLVTAYGTNEIKALKLWLRLYKKQYKLRINNIQVIQEKYQLEIINSLQQYTITNFLVSREKNKELNQIKSTTKFNKVLSAYIMANFLPFFNHIGYRHDRNNKEIDVIITKVKKLPIPFKLFKNASRLTGYTVSFKTNLVLPHIIAIGQSTAMGYGVVNWKD